MTTVNEKRMSRREWVAGMAGLGLASTSSGYTTGPQENSSPEIVDAHAHVWTSDTMKYPLATGFRKKDVWFPSFSIEELIELQRPVGISRANLIQMTWYGLDHSYILDAIASSPDRFVGTGIVPAITDVSLASPDRAMVDLAMGGIYAFRIRGKSTRPPLANGSQWMDHPGFEKMFTAGAEHNLALSFLMTVDDLPELDRMCKRHPECPVIIDHFCLIGRRRPIIDSEIQTLCRIARYPRVMLKIGAFYALGAETPPYLDMLPLIERVVDAFGPERCMWESDAPLQTKPPHNFEAAVAVIRGHADFLSRSDKDQILFRTAEDFFFNR